MESKNTKLGLDIPGLNAESLSVDRLSASKYFKFSDKLIV